MTTDAGDIAARMLAEVDRPAEQGSGFDPSNLAWTAGPLQARWQFGALQ